VPERRVADERGQRRDGRDRSCDLLAFVLAFAAGAILTMLADTTMPEAYEHSGAFVGVMTTLGFITAFAIQQPDRHHAHRVMSEARRRATVGR
jgi:hypothetical protein